MGQDRTEHEDVLFSLILIARHNPRCFAYFVPFKLHRKQLRQVLGSPHFTDEKTKAEKLKDLPKVTELKSHGPVDGSQHLSSHTLGYMLCLKGYPSNKKQTAMQRFYPESIRERGPEWKWPRKGKTERLLKRPRWSHFA